MAVIYSQNFSAGPSVWESAYQYNMSGGLLSGTPHSIDPTYPAIDLAEAVSVQTIGGRTGVSLNPAFTGSPNFANYTSLGLVFDSANSGSFGTLTGGLFPMNRLCWSVDYYVDSASLAEFNSGTTYIPFQLSRHPTAWSPSIYIYHNGPGSGSPFELHGPWGTLTQSASVPALGWHTYRFELQCEEFTATSSTTWTVTNANGYFKFWNDGALLFDVQGLGTVGSGKLISTLADSVPAARILAIGYAGMWPWTNLVLSDCSDSTIPVDNVPKCCSEDGSSTGPGGGVVSPPQDVTVIPGNVSLCSLGGTISGAATPSPSIVWLGP